MNPLVSIIIPTKPGRERFLELALANATAQDYPNKEILWREDKRGIGCGPMRNELCEDANGDICAHHDDDDWLDPHWLSRGVSEILSGAHVCGTSKHWLYDLRNGASMLVDRHQPRCPGLMFLRQAWQNHPFPSVKAHEIVLFLRGHQGHIADLKDPNLMVQFVHDDNTVDYPRTKNHLWAREQIDAAMGPTLSKYIDLKRQEA